MADGMAASTRALPAIRTITLAEVTAEIHQEVARSGGILGSCYAVALAASMVATPEATPPQPLSALLRLDGLAFIAAAYATVLGRAPDAVGTAHIAAQLDAGRSKVVLLAGLQRSPEARQRGTRLAGLRRRYVAARLYQMPILGPVAQLAARALRRSGLSRRLGGREAAVPGMATSLATMAAAGETTQLLLARHQAALEGVAARIAAVQAAQEALTRKTLAAAAEQSGALVELADRQAALAQRLAALEDSLADPLPAMPRAAAACPPPVAPSFRSRREDLLAREA